MAEQSDKFLLGVIKGHTEQILVRVEEMERRQVSSATKSDVQELKDRISAFQQQPERCLRKFVTRMEAGAIVVTFTIILALLEILFKWQVQ